MAIKSVFRFESFVMFIIDKSSLCRNQMSYNFEISFTLYAFSCVGCNLAFVSQCLNSPIGSVFCMVSCCIQTLLFCLYLCFLRVLELKLLF